MLPHISALLSGGLIAALLVGPAFGQVPTIQPEQFGCKNSFESNLPRLIQELKSPDEKVREQAIVTLGSHGERARPAAAALVDVAVTQRGHAKALQALAQIDAESTRKALRQLLVGGKGRCRCGIAFNDVVAQAGPIIVPHLISLLPEDALRANIETTLIQIGEPAVVRIVPALEQPIINVRQSLYRVLGAIGGKAKYAVPALEKRFNVESGLLKVTVAQSLCMIDTNHPASFTFLHDVVRGDDAKLRVAALHALADGRVTAKQLIPTMVKLITDETEQHSYLAALVLAGIGKDAAQPLIDAAAGANDKQTRRIVSALVTLGQLAPGAVPLLIGMVESGNIESAQQAVSSLPQFGPAAKAAIPTLRKTVNSANFGLRLTALDALIAIDAGQTSMIAKPLVEVLRRGSADEKQRALYALTRYRPAHETVVPTMIAMLKTESISMRMSVANALSTLAPTQMDAAMPTLLEALNAQPKNRAMMNSALRLLGKAGPQAKDAIPALKAMLTAALRNSNAPMNVNAIVDTLKRIGGEKEFMPIIMASLNSQNSEERAEARYLVEDMLGRPALAPLEAALAAGDLRTTPEVAALLKQLRQN